LETADNETVGSRVSARALALVEGAIDFHVHPAPSARPRRANAYELSQQAQGYGMRGLLLKDHDRQTAVESSIVNGLLGTDHFTLFGSACLNSPLGGVNPATVEAAIDVGARAIFMPTDNALNDARFFEKLASQGEHLGGAAKTEGREWAKHYTVIDDEGALTDSAMACVKLCATRQATLCTGHLAAKEISALVDEAANVGAQVVVTHARSLSGATPSDLSRWVEAGALLEITYISCCPSINAPRSVRRTVAEEVEFIESLGPSSFVLSTDFGQAVNMPPADALVEFIDGLLAEGLGESAIVTMTHHNPSKALNLGQESEL
jgi:hypothetical protein